MKKICIALWIFAAVFSVCVDSSAETIEEARAAFEATYLDVFKGRVAASAETVANDLRYDKAKERGKWRFMLQVAEDGRVRFIDAEFSSGRFVSGTLHVFGLDSQKLSAADFCSLRRSFVMAVSKKDASSSSPVVVHRSGDNRLERVVEKKVLRNFRLNPIDDLWGAFPSVMKRRGIKTDTLACRVEYISKEGVRGTIGEFVNKKKSDRYDERALYKAIVNIHASAGEDSARITQRKAVDLYVGSRLIYTPIDLSKNSFK